MKVYDLAVHNNESTFGWQSGPMEAENYQRAYQEHMKRGHEKIADAIRAACLLYTSDAADE